MQMKLAIAAGLVALSGYGLYVYLRHSPTLNEGDAVLLTDFINQTKEPAFDDSLREALGISLSQSPYFNIVSSEKVAEALKAVNVPVNQRVTPELGSKLCGTTHAKAFITSTISSTDGSYRISLEAKSCADFTTFARTQAKAASPLQVLHVLGASATDLRKQFGEHQETLQKFDVPLERAASPFLEALKLYSEGRRLTREKGPSEGIAALEKAVDLDPRFAIAYSSLAVNHYNLNQNAKASEEIQRAFEMGDRQTARERLQITTLYYDLGTGDVNKAIASYRQWASLYPSDDVPWGDLSSEFFLIGDYQQAALNARQALRLEPTSTAWFENLSTALIALEKLDEAEENLKEASAKGLSDPSLDANRYAVAFLRGNTAAMEAERHAVAGTHEGADTMLALAADTEAYSGHLKNARELSRRAVEAARNAELAEPAAIWQGLAALREASFGNREEARRGAEESLRFAPNSRDVQTLAAFVFARAGEQRRAQTLVDDVRARYVTNTIVQGVWIPTIRAQTEMLQGNSKAALQLLEPVAPYERGQMIGNLSNCCLLPIYLRGEVLLADGQAVRAMAEFQKILDDRGIVVNCWAGSLARLGLARAQALAGYNSAARTSYESFFAVWNNADPDIPILRSARAEFAKLK
jgi:eukaryotic-like serine/threonine-protein kinase